MGKRERRFAEVAWLAEDVVARSGMSEAQAEDFLTRHSGRITDLMVERGAEAIDTFLAAEGWPSGMDPPDEEVA